MANLQFNEEQDIYRRPDMPQYSFLTRFVLGTGLVKTEQGAQYLLLGVAVVCILAALWLTLSSSTSAPPPSPFKTDTTY